MTEQELRLANELMKKINNLESFIRLASERGFAEKLFKDKRLILTSRPIPLSHEEKKGLRLNKELTFKVIEVLRKQVDDWRDELANI